MSVLLPVINKDLLRKDLPIFSVGDHLEVVIYKNFSSQNFYTFKGIVISQKNFNFLSYSFTLLKEINKLVVTSVFFYHLSPIISIKKIEKKKMVRRAKLYYLKRKLFLKKQN